MAKVHQDNSGKFQKGNPGGPGRPVGSRGATNRLLDQLAAESAEAILRKQIEIAGEGDPRAADQVLKRAWTMPKGRPIELDLPAIEEPADLVRAHAVVVAAMATRIITPEEAASVSAVLEAQRRAFEVVDLAQRVEQLEARVLRYKTELR